MRILFVSQMYPPEMGAAANRMYPLVRELACAGHAVVVATGMPNYPRGKVHAGYQGKLFSREKRDGAEVIRTAYLTAERNRSRRLQLLSYLAFVPAAFRSGLVAGPADIVFVTSPPIFPVLAAAALARAKGARLVFDIRDLWPDELITYGGAGPESLPVRLIRRIERWTYRRADCISATTESLLETVVDRGAARQKTMLLPNGADLELFRPLPAKNPVSDQYHFGDRIVVLYSGLLGIKHGLEALLQAAFLLRERREIVFFLLGSGAREGALIDETRKLGLENVLFGGERAVEEVPHLLARADLCFAAIRPEPYPKKVISVKIFEYLACEKPVVGALDGESARVLEESGGGIVVAPGDAPAIADAISALADDRMRRRAMGAMGREYVRLNYSRGAWARRLEERLRHLAQPL